MTKRQLHDAMVAMDTDGSGRIEFDEFDRWWSAECGRKASRRKAEDEIDVTSLVDIVVDGPELTLQADGEGYILRAGSEDEAERWVQALRLAREVADRLALFEELASSADSEHLRVRPSTSRSR